MNKEEFNSKITDIVSGDYTNNEQINDIIEEIKDLVKEQYDKEVDSDQLKESLLEISYRNTYLLNNAGIKVDSAIKQKKNKVSEIVEYLDDICFEKEEVEEEKEEVEDKEDKEDKEVVTEVEEENKEVEDKEVATEDEEKEEPIYVEDDHDINNDKGEVTNIFDNKDDDIFLPKDNYGISSDIADFNDNKNLETNPYLLGAYSRPYNSSYRSYNDANNDFDNQTMKDSTVRIKDLCNKLIDCNVRKMELLCFKKYRYCC